MCHVCDIYMAHTSCTFCCSNKALPLHTHTRICFSLQSQIIFKEKKTDRTRIQFNQQTHKTMTPSLFNSVWHLLNFLGVSSFVFTQNAGNITKKMHATVKNLNQKRKDFFTLLTWVGVSDNSSTTKVAAIRHRILLIITIECKRGMVSNRIRIITFSSCLNCRTISSTKTTSIVQSNLQRNL